MGEEWPTPTVIFHSSLSALGHVKGIAASATYPSRLGPRHCGQSALRLAVVNRIIALAVRILDHKRNMFIFGDLPRNCSESYADRLSLTNESSGAVINVVVSAMMTIIT